MARGTSPEHSLDLPAIKTWYYEAAQLKLAISKTTAHFHERIKTLYNESLTDPLTGLMNRRAMQLVLEQYEFSQTPFSLFMCDIDHFKHVNDTYGHDIGDEVLVVLAKQIQALNLDQATLCRSGGEEFIIILPNTVLEQAEHHAEHLHARLKQVAMPIPYQITVSIGVAYWPGPELSIHSVLKQVDQAMYQAKHQGRNQTVSA